ncbi:NAD-binding Rossmann fold oxidoreductase [Agrocybe pediades]|nr:NAD-binding Rossmann fold oxidoreductase [Agrocybe pediades]
MSNPPRKVGFIGLSNKGWASTALAPSLLHPRLQGAYDLVAVSTTSEASAQASAEKYSKDFGHPIKAYHGDSAKIASDPEVDLVAVAVKAPYHKQVILPVIEAKKDFFLEWPAGISTEETRAIAEAARKQGVRSIIGLQGRHSVALTKAKELIASGAIGAVKSTNVLAHFAREAHFFPPIVSEALNTQYNYLLEKKNGATSLRIAIGHQLDQLTHVLGDFVSVSATDALFYPVGTVVDADGKPTGKTVQTDVPEHYSITGFLESGILVNAFWRGGYASGEGTGRRQYVWEIDGEEGTVRFESNATMGALPAMFEPDLYLNGKKVEFATPGNVVENISVAWKEFADGKGNYATIEDAVKHGELLDAIDRSAQEGRRIDL